MLQRKQLFFEVIAQQDIASQAEVGIMTVRQVEAGIVEPRRATLVVLRQAFEATGIEFIDENGGGAGVWLRKAAQKNR